MALWTFVKNGLGVSWKEDGVDVSSFDDGLNFIPGEDGFTEDHAAEKAKALGKGVIPAYTGTPGWHSRIEAEAKVMADAAEKKAMNDALDAALNPSSAEDKINAHFDAMVAQMPEREEDINTLRQRALDEAKAE